jgi:hypothetical protein
MQRSGISETGRAASTRSPGARPASCACSRSIIRQPRIGSGRASTQSGSPRRLSWCGRRFAPEQFADLLADRGFEILERVGYADVEPRWGLPALNIGDERVVLAVRRD